jgi:methyltransferase
LGKNWNTKVIYNPSDELSITTGGIYKYIRHPNYLVVIFELTALSLFHSAYFSFIIFSILNFMLLFFRIRFEENELFKNSKYSNHFLDKKRFIPGLF